MSVSGCRGSPGFRVFLHHVTPADLQVVVVVVVNVEHRAVSSVGGGGVYFVNTLSDRFTPRALI